MSGARYGITGGQVPYTVHYSTGTHLVRRIPYVGLDYQQIREIAARFERGEPVTVADAVAPPAQYPVSPELFYAYQSPSDRPRGRP